MDLLPPIAFSWVLDPLSWIASVVLQPFADRFVHSRSVAGHAAKAVVGAQIRAEHIIMTTERMESELRAVGCDLGRGRT